MRLGRIYEYCGILNLVLLQWAAAQQRAQNAPVVKAGRPASFDKTLLQIFFQKLLHEFERWL